MNKENCVLKLVDEIIVYYDARSEKHQIYIFVYLFIACGLLYDISVTGTKYFCNWH